LDQHDNFPLWSIGQELATSFVENYSEYTGLSEVKQTSRGKTFALTSQQKKTYVKKITDKSINLNLNPSET
jgi:hypothetical protein